jgi:hypothetical protein
MPIGNKFSALLVDFGRCIEADCSPDDDGAVRFESANGTLFHIFEATPERFVVIAETGISTEKFSSAIRLEVMEVCLQINFSVSSSSSFSIAQSPEKTVVLTCSEDASFMNGVQLLHKIEILSEKVGLLAEIINDIASSELGATSQDATTGQFGQLA